MEPNNDVTMMDAQESTKHMVELKLNSGESIKVSRELAEQSLLIKDMLEEEEDDDNVPVIPLPNISDFKVLQKVVDFFGMSEDLRSIELEKPLKGNFEDLVPNEIKNYFDIETPLHIKLIMAANYLNIKSLLDFSCAKIASSIKGKSPEQIREMFGIENDFSPEEEAKIREENKWCEAE
jgi:S-phase kinase-associated protein 1